jgi:DNA transposition AAA+ family ATPase
MENLTKQRIADQLNNYVGKVGSQNRASKLLNGVSVATISNILSQKWESIADDMWRNIDKQTSSQHWITADTVPSKLLRDLFEDARQHSNVFGICADAGSGKTKVSEEIKLQDAVYVVSCNEFFNRKTFLAELLQAMGKDSGGYTVNEMMQTIIKNILAADRPLLVLDEADKLSDQVLYFFISLYNKLEDKCGIVMMATDHLEKRIERGLRLNKKGYKEIYSRLGRKFLHLPRITKKDVEAVVTANGITDKEKISIIWNESEGDLRRVKRLVHREKQTE